MRAFIILAITLALSGCAMLEHWPSPSHRIVDRNGAVTGYVYEEPK
jgi:hypothetical protein